MITFPNTRSTLELIDVTSPIARGTGMGRNYIAEIRRADGSLVFAEEWRPALCADESARTQVLGFLSAYLEFGDAASEEFGLDNAMVEWLGQNAEDIESMYDEFACVDADDLEDE